MKWSNLKNNKCPKCDKPLTPEKGSLFSKYVCSCCSFSIMVEKFEKIVNNLYKPHQPQELHNSVPF